MATTTNRPRHPRIRPARDGDAQGVIRLVARCFAGYPGCILDCETEETGLLAPRTRFEAFWVAEDAGEIVGSIACGSETDVDGVRGVRLHKLYVHPERRRLGLGRRLIGLVERRAREAGGRGRVFLWSDVRFVEAHAVYERLGYVRGAERRALRDLSATVEYRYAKDVGGAEAVTTPDA